MSKKIVNINIKNLIGTVVIINTKDKDSIEQLEELIKTTLVKAVKASSLETE
jgi:hypothetical protein